MFFKTKKRQKEALTAAKMAESQLTLIQAATDTAEAARDVAASLKSKIDDAFTQLENTARIINDALFLCSEDGSIVTSNTAATAMFGYDAQNVLEVFDMAGAPLPDAATLWDHIQHTSSWMPSSRRPLRCKRDNDLIWVEPKMSRLVWSDGSKSILVLIRSIDSLVKIQKSAQEARKRYRALMDKSVDGILVIQHDLIIAANPAARKIFGYEIQELLGQPISFLFHESDHDLIIEHEVVHTIVKGVHDDNTTVDLLFTAVPIEWHDEPAKLVTVRDTFTPK
jgi:PAS domain S-box-containing protein